MNFFGTIRESGVSLEPPKEAELTGKEKRTAVRFIIFDTENKIALNHRPKQGEYEEQIAIPGGGVEEGENVLDALRREALEEIGVKIKNIKEIGYTTECYEKQNLIQTSHFFTGNVDGEKGEPSFTEDEKRSNLGVVWRSIGDAIDGAKRGSDGFSKTRSLLVLNILLDSLN